MVSGAGNYLWCTIIILLFLLPYRKYIENKHSFKDNTLNLILMFIVGIFTGWTNENTGGAIILLNILFIDYYKLKNIKIPNWSISVFASSCIGFGLLFFAPGNNARKEHLVNKTVDIVKNIRNVFGTSFTLMFGLTILFKNIIPKSTTPENNLQPTNALNSFNIYHQS